MANEHECFHEEDFRRLENLVASVFAKMDSFLADMRQIAVGDAKQGERVSTLRRDVDVMFERMRLQDDEIKKINQWKDELKGSIRVWVGVPSVLATVLAIIQIIKLLGG